MSEQIIQVDRRYRRIVLIAVALCACLGTTLIQWVLPWAKNALAELKPEQAVRLLQITISLVFLSVLPLAWYLWSLARKIVDAQQMPPPHVKVIKNVKVITGPPAVARGKALMIVAVLLALVSLAGGIWLPWKFGQVMSRDARNPADQVETQVGAV